MSENNERNGQESHTELFHNFNCDDCYLRTVKKIIHKKFKNISR